MSRMGAGLAVAILAILVIPWPTTFPALLIDAFDQAMMTVSPRGAFGSSGQVRVAPHEVVLSTVSRSQPTVHVLTAQVPFAMTFTVSITKRDPGESFPFQVKVWNPRVESAAEAWYAPDGTIMAGFRTNDKWLQTTRLGAYTVNSTQRWRIVRDAQRVTFEVWSNGIQAAFEVDRQRYPALFAPDPVSLTMYASADDGGSSIAVIRNPLIVVPHLTDYGAAVHNPWFCPLIGLAAVCSLTWVAAWIRTRWRRPNLRTEDAGILLLLAGSTLLVGWSISNMPGHPYDMRSLQVWSQLAREHGFLAIHTYSYIATEGGAHGGLPYAAMTFPYPPLLTYPYWIAAKIAPTEEVERTFKILISLGVAVSGGLLFLMLRQVHVGVKLAALAAGAYVLNPAVVFDSAVWGQTDALVSVFLLMALAGVIVRSAPLVWIGALAAVLTKQTGGLIAPAIVAMAFVRLGWRQMVQAVPAAILVVFLALAPAFLAGIHPSAIYRPLVSKVLEFGTIRGMETVNALVSQSSFTLWSAVTGLEGVQGWSRLTFPDFVPSRFGPSYFFLSRIVFALFVILLGVLLARKRQLSPGAIFLGTAVYAVGAAVLLTRIMPRYFYFGLMFTAASLPWMPRKMGITTLAILTGTMLLSMWGLLVFVNVSQRSLLPAFAPGQSWLNAAVLEAVSSDIGITLGTILNTAVLVSLMLSLYLDKRHEVPSM